MKATINEPKIKIYVVCHKEEYVPECELLYPIQVGTSLVEQEIPNILHDNTGDNISLLNKRYCELTAQYWAWKNDEADYYGFMHYRRYFSFNPAKLEEDCFGNLVFDNITEGTLKKLFYTPQYIKDFIINYDVITVTPTDLKEIGKTIYGHYRDYSHDHRIEDLELAMKIIIRDYPDFRNAVNSYINSTQAYFCNMYILNKKIFNEYNEWLFDILHKHECERDYDDYSIEEYRISAFLAERLWGIYYTYLKESQKVKTAELQRTLFLNTTKQNEIYPAFPRKNIPIILSASQNYLPYVATVIQSIIDNSTDLSNFDILILHSNIDNESKKKLLNQFESLHNLSLRFYDVSQLILDLHFSVNSHFSKENYFRLLIQFFMKNYEKIIYLDSDLIVLDDLTKLFDIDISDYLVAAIKDVDWIAAYNKTDPQRKEYSEKILNLKNPYEYFNSGVLLYNVKKFNELFDYNTIAKMISAQDWMFVDQDILNILCAGKVKYLDMSWNVLTDYCEAHYSRIKSARAIPHLIYEEYIKSYKKPKIVHYAGCKKPWEYPESDKANLFWIYARKLDYYEEILTNMFSCKLKVAEQVPNIECPQPLLPPSIQWMDNQGIKIKGLDIPIYVDGIMVKLISKFNNSFPIDSKRRKYLRKILGKFV